jgi:hypothetical protein
MKTANELADFIDHVVAALNSDYDVIFDETRALYEPSLPSLTKTRLEWNTIHIHTSLNTLLTSLKRHQKYLKEINAGKTI